MLTSSIARTLCRAQLMEPLSQVDGREELAGDFVVSALPLPTSTRERGVSLFLK